jgi:multidrug efflux pump subunit AcrB
VRRLPVLIVCAACSRGGVAIDAPPAIVAVTAAWPGHAPAEACAKAAPAIAQALAADHDVAHTAATCRGDHVEVDALVRDGADAGAVRARFVHAEAAVAHELPDGAVIDGEDVRPRGVRMRAILRGADRVRARAEAIAPRVREHDVRLLGVCGGEVERVRVELAPDRLAALGLGADEVVTAIQHQPPLAPDAIGRAIVARAGGRDVALADVAAVLRQSVPSPCAPPGPPDAAALDVEVLGDQDSERAAANLLRATARDAQLEVEIVHAPVPYAVAIGGADAKATHYLAVAWRGALAATAGVTVEPPPGRDAIWSIDRDAAARTGVGAAAATIAARLMAGELHATSAGDAPVAIDLASGDPDPEHVPVHGGAAQLVHVSDVATSRDDDDRADAFDGAPAVIVRFTAPGLGAPDDLARAAIDTARRAAPPPAGVRVTAWREP